MFEAPKDIIISMSELAFVSEKIEVVVEETNLEDLLWFLGLNVKHSEGYECMYCTHRNLFGDVVTCNRYWGWMRTDDEWLLRNKEIT